jgi:hypothetical protein
MAGATLIAAPEGTGTHSTATYTCPGCAHGLRVSGLGRHRVYFELGDERSYDPVMNRVCPECGHGLPGKGAPRSRL